MWLYMNGLDQQKCLFYSTDRYESNTMMVILSVDFVFQRSFQDFRTLNVSVASPHTGQRPRPAMPHYSNAKGKSGEPA